MILRQLKTIQEDNELEQFLELSKQIIDSYVKFSIEKLEQIISKNVQLSEEEANRTHTEVLRRKYSDLKAASLNKDYRRILKNIIRFRT